MKKKDSEGTSAWRTSDGRVALTIWPPNLTRRDRAVDPATVAAVVKAGVAYYQGAQQSAWQASVSGKLDEISSKLDEVLRELQALRAWHVEHDLEVARTSFRSEIESTRRLVEGILIGIGDQPPDDNTKARLLGHGDRIRITADMLANWRRFGFAPYAAVLSGASTYLLVLKLVGGTAGEASQWAKWLIADFIEHALDPKEPKSLAWAREAAVLEAASNKQTYLGRLNRWWKINGPGGRPIGEGDGPYHPGPRWCVQANATGSFEAGYDWGVREVEDSGDWFPDLPRHFDMGSGDRAPAIESFAASFGRHRNAAIAAFQREADLADHMQALATAKDELEKLIIA